MPGGLSSAVLAPALAALLLASGSAWAAPARAAAPPATPDAFPRAAASYAVVRDGRLLWARAPDAPRAPASLTKIMTALLALEAGLPPDAWVTVSERAARETGSRLGLRAGEALAAGEALRATLVASANDACLALAEHVAGSEVAFVARMNARAQALGLSGTRFENPCGHDARGHRSTARDLLALVEAALARPAFREAVALEGGEVRTREGRVIAYRTSNALLGRLPGAAGVKTGYTARAGRCIAALARRGGSEVRVVLLDAADRWWAAAALVEAAFEEGASGGAAGGPAR